MEVGVARGESEGDRFTAIPLYKVPIGCGKGKVAIGNDTGQPGR